jgi:hypothetical protein
MSVKDTIGALCDEQRSAEDRDTDERALIERGQGGLPRCDEQRSAEDRDTDERLPRSTHEIVVHLGGLIKDWRDGQPLHQEDRDFLMELMLECPLPSSLGLHGRRLKSDAVEIAEANALDWGRKRYQEVKSSFDSAELAWRSVANEMLGRYEKPLFVKQPNVAESARWSIRYLIDRLQRTAPR